MSIYEVMRYCRNFFPASYGAFQGEWVITDGTLDLSDCINDNQYFFIEGSSSNDGVYKAPAIGELEDETFTGVITPLNPPKAFIRLCEEMQAWEAQYGGVNSTNMSPYQSESFGGYSYTKASGNAGTGGSVSVWDVFSKKLAIWRRH